MPTIAQNLKAWNRDWHWPLGGEEWSDAWGSAELQWEKCILPRIEKLQPSGNILEIGPGYGRWTQYLAEFATSLVAVDLSPRCIEACKIRFRDDAKVVCVINDGRNLDVVGDGSLDFVFSFDSLVHAEADVIRSYLSAIASKLKPDGRAFIHHSNWKAYPRYSAFVGKLPIRMRSVLVRLRILDNVGWRGLSVSAELVREMAAEVGLHCVAQEIVNWNSERLGDCLSTFARPGSHWDSATKITINPDFMREAAAIRRGV